MHVCVSDKHLQVTNCFQGRPVCDCGYAVLPHANPLLIDDNYKDDEFLSSELPLYSVVMEPNMM